jgi:hypothetical protein
MKFKATLTSMITAFVLLPLLAICAQAQVTVNESAKTYGCLANGNSTASIKQAYVNTGWKELDDAMLEDIGALDKAFGVNVSVYFLNDGAENAFFTAQKFPALMRADGINPNTPVTGSMFIDAALLKKEFKETGGSGMSIPAIMAHEFAHGMQHSNNFPYSGKWQELHADFMAGWFIAVRGIFRPQNPNQAWISISEKGDYEFFDEGHHGTPQERAEAFATGFLLLSQGKVVSSANAYNLGIQYLRNKGAR